MKEKVLIVEDNKILCDTLASILQKEGYSVECSYNGKKAFQLIKDNKFDVLVVDYKLPDISGWVILKKFLKNRKYPSAIMISANADNSIKECVTRKNVLFLDKPFNNKELISALNSISTFIKAG